MLTDTKLIETLIARQSDLIDGLAEERAQHRAMRMALEKNTAAIEKLSQNLEIAMEPWRQWLNQQWMLRNYRGW